MIVHYKFGGAKAIKGEFYMSYNWLNETKQAIANDYYFKQIISDSLQSLFVGRAVYLQSLCQRHEQMRIIMETFRKKGFVLQATEIEDYILIERVRVH